MDYGGFFFWLLDMWLKILLRSLFATQSLKQTEKACEKFNYMCNVQNGRTMEKID